MATQTYHTPYARAQSLLQRITAEDLTFDVVNTMKYAYAFDNDGIQDDPATPDHDEALETSYDDWYHHLANALDIRARIGRLNAGGRLDVNYFGNTVYRPESYNKYCRGEEIAATWCNWRDKRYVNQLNAERLFLAWTTEATNVTIGDFYATFGNGMALHTIKIDQLGQDTAIRGVNVNLNLGAFDVTVLGGKFNFMSVDHSTGMDAPWREDLIVGGQLLWTPFDGVIVGGHGVIVDQHEATTIDEEDNVNADRNRVYGGTLEIPSLLDGNLSLSAEVDIHERRQNGKLVGPHNNVEGDKGFAGYANVSGQIGPATILAEAKNYDNFGTKAATWGGDAPYELHYHQSPRLERPDAELKQNHSIRGVRGRVDVDLTDFLDKHISVFANMGHFTSWNNVDHADGLLDDESHTIMDPFAGLDASWGDGDGHLNVLLGRRSEYNTTLDAISQRDDHLTLALEQSIGGVHEIHLSMRVLLREKPNPGAEEGEPQSYTWREGSISVEYAWRPHISVFVGLERQEDRDAIINGRKNYIMGGVTYYHSSHSHIKLQVGSNKPGLQCAGGGCRYVQAFDGLQALWVSRLPGS